MLLSWFPTPVLDFIASCLTTRACPVKCDCTRFEDLRLCVHLLAVGYYEKCLPDVIRKYQPNISSIVKSSKKQGRNPTSQLRREGRLLMTSVTFPSTAIPLMTVTFPPRPLQNNGTWSSSDTKMRKCYGCGGNVRQHVNFEPPSPWNIILTRCEYRTFTPCRTNSLRISMKKENVCYHP